ncbi:hypothetical protein [Metabacillus niabensis]|uniref:hypothetical protein n=1 Tax=Metabacillus niabensis TaxID=324854 RepID=UPI001CFA6C6D|nr:hypothetical protein [Metabacillus niabensis]
MGMISQMKQFVFTIDSKEVVIYANGILNASSEILRIADSKSKIKFVGVRY